MSTQPIQPAWKQEVNQRLAAHKNRKAGSPAEITQPDQPATSRAGEAAARVAARYAKAPSYSQMQAEEARAAVRAAEIATQVAMQAQAAAATVLAELHAAAQERMRGPAVVESITRAPQTESAEELLSTPASSAPDPVPVADSGASVTAPEKPAVFTQEVVEGRSFNLRWEPDMPAGARRMPVVPPRASEPFELAVEDWWTPAQLNATLHSEPIQVDAASAHANLIQFPRELVAARKLRPRLAEAAGVADREAQLSIFEVDPGTVSFDPGTDPEPQLSSAYSVAGWSGMELDAHPEPEPASQSQSPARTALFLAPFGLRVMAMVIDLSLILASVSTAAMAIGSKLTHLPAPRPAEVLAILGLLTTGFAYHALFFAFSNMTPGMRYAGIALCTLDGDVPTRQQLRRRLGAMAVSLLPLALGVMWSVFDEDHLSWHDRISATYLRRR